MRTTIDLDVGFLDEVVRESGSSSRREAIEEGLKLLSERTASHKLAQAFGVLRGKAKVSPRRRVSRRGVK